MSKVKNQSAPRKRGRPRSEAARQSILNAAAELLEELGPTRLTVEAVATRAKVGKPTIYRYWANAQELAMAALMAKTALSTSPRDDGPDALKDIVADVIDRLNSKRGRQMALMLAQAEPDGELFKAFSNRIIMEGRGQALEIMKAEIAAGRLDAEADANLLVDMIFGVVLFRLLMRHAPLQTDLAENALKVALGRAE